MLLHQAQQGVFHEAAAGEGGEAAGFVDCQQMGVFKQNFEVLRGVRFLEALIFPARKKTAPDVKSGRFFVWLPFCRGFLGYIAHP